MAETFPRTTDLPKQSPLFWVAHKDRYLRQLLIRDIEAATGRSLVVYFADDTSPDCQINHGEQSKFDWQRVKASTSLPGERLSVPSQHQFA